MPKSNGTMNQVMPRIAKLAHALDKSNFTDIFFEHTESMGWSVRLGRGKLATQSYRKSPLDAMYDFESILIAEVRKRIAGYSYCRAPHGAEVEELSKALGEKVATVTCNESHQ